MRRTKKRLSRLLLTDSSLSQGRKTFSLYLETPKISVSTLKYWTGYHPIAETELGAVSTAPKQVTNWISEGVGRVSNYYHLHQLCTSAGPLAI